MSFLDWSRSFRTPAGRQSRPVRATRLDRETRSATVVADEEVICYVLSRQAFDALGAANKDIALKLLTNLGRELSLRLRRANRMLTQVG